MTDQEKPKRKRKPGTEWRRGRPITLTAEIQERIMQVVRASGNYVDAARHVGLHYDTVRVWDRRGRKAAAKQEQGGALNPDEQKLYDFHVDLERAKVAGKIGALACLTGAARTDYRAADIYLRRLYPDEYGDRTEIRVSTRPDLRKLTDAELDQLAELAAKAAPDGDEDDL